ncbi:MAG: hypothetical protein J6P42_05615, partial [Oscillospiraceae bacterium]|nr:hypothetical protein [Oscillospiraceae bacterium]
MIRLLRADFKRLRKSFSFRLSLIGMIILSSGFMTMQATGMYYTVPLSRVIFLPMSMFGIAMAAFVSVFVGTDFSDGFIRNKLLTSPSRSSLVMSHVIVSSVACIIVYLVITAFSAGVGQFFFENNVTSTEFFRYFLLGIGMSMVTGCLFSVITLLCGNKTNAVIWCMGLAFGMLFLCLHTNELLVQTEYKDGALNPHYISGIRRVICSI